MAIRLEVVGTGRETRVTADGERPFYVRTALLEGQVRLDGKEITHSLVLVPQCYKCVLTQECRQCRRCPAGLVRSERINWDVYREVRRYIRNRPKGQGELMARLHYKLAEVQALHSVYSEVSLTGKLLLVDPTGQAHNPTGIHAEQMLFHSLDDVESWKELRQAEAADTSDWMIFTK